MCLTDTQTFTGLRTDSTHDPLCQPLEGLIVNHWGLSCAIHLGFAEIDVEVVAYLPDCHWAKLLASCRLSEDCLPGLGSRWKTGFLGRFSPVWTMSLTAEPFFSPAMKSKVQDLPTFPQCPQAGYSHQGTPPRPTWTAVPDHSLTHACQKSHRGDLHSVDSDIFIRLSHKTINYGKLNVGYTLIGFFF